MKTMQEQASSLTLLPKISLGFNTIDNDLKIEEETGDLSTIRGNKNMAKISLNNSQDSDASENQELEKLLAEG